MEIQHQEQQDFVIAFCSIYLSSRYLSGFDSMCKIMYVKLPKADV